MATFSSPQLTRTATLVLVCATILWTCDSVTTSHEGELKQTQGGEGGGQLAVKKSLSVLLVSPPWAGKSLRLSPRPKYG